MARGIWISSGVLCIQLQAGGGSLEATLHVQCNKDSVITDQRRLFSLTFLNKKEKNFAVLTLSHRLRCFVIHLIVCLDFACD